jgi:hypothetical protein
MTSLRRVKVAAFKARLQMREAERLRIAEMATRSQVNLARIRELMDDAEHDIRILSNELKLLDIRQHEE